jgi:hypothetical protein
MGFFSKTCAKTHLPILVAAKGIDKLNHVVALLPDGNIVSGSYDGYGRVAGIELRDDWPKVKMILKEYYNGEGYNDVGKSGDELAQGYFMDKKFIHYCLIHGPFKDRAEYVRAFKKHANWH